MAALVDDPTMEPPGTAIGGAALAPPPNGRLRLAALSGFQNSLMAVTATSGGAVLPGSPSGSTAQPLPTQGPAHTQLPGPHGTFAGANAAPGGGAAGPGPLGLPRAVLVQYQQAAAAAVAAVVATADVCDDGVGGGGGGGAGLPSEGNPVRPSTSRLGPRPPPRSSDPGIAAVRPAHAVRTSRLVRNASASGRPPPPPPPPPLLLDVGTMVGSSSQIPYVSGGVSSNGSRRYSSNGGGLLSSSARGQTLAAAAVAATRAIGSGGGAISPSFRRQSESDGAAAAQGVRMSPSFRRQISGGGGLNATSESGSVGSAAGHVLMPYGDVTGGGSPGTRSFAHYDRSGGGGSDSGIGSSGHRRHWFRGLLCFFRGRNSDDLVGYKGQDDLAVIAAKQRKLRKSASRRLSKALSDTLMVRSSRHTVTSSPVVVVGGSAGADGAATSCPGLAGGTPGEGGSPGHFLSSKSSRKLQPMLSQQPHKSILKSTNSVKRKAGDAEPVLVKVGSARLGAGTVEITAAAAAAAAAGETSGVDADLEDRDFGGGGAAVTDAAAAAPAPAGEEPVDGEAQVGNGLHGGCGRPATLSTAGLAARVRRTLTPVDDLDIDYTPACTTATDDMASHARGAAASSGQVVSPMTTSPSGRWPGGGKAVGVAAMGVAGDGGGGGGSCAASGGGMGWMPDLPRAAMTEAAITPPEYVGGGLANGRSLLKFMSIQHSRLGTAVSPNALISADTPPTMPPSSAASGVSGRMAAVSANGTPNPTSTGAAAGGGGASGETGGRMSLVHRIITKQMSRSAAGAGAGGAGGGSGAGSPRGGTGPGSGATSAGGRTTPRNAVLPLPPLAVGNQGDPLHPTSPQQLHGVLSPFRHPRVEDAVGPAAAPAALSQPASPSGLEVLRRRRTMTGRSSKLAAGGSGSGAGGPEADDDVIGNPLYIEPERATAPAAPMVLREVLGWPTAGGLAADSLVGRNHQRITTTGSLAFGGAEVDGNAGGVHGGTAAASGCGGGGGGGAPAAAARGYVPAGSESSRWRLTVQQAIHDHSEAAAAAAVVASVASRRGNFMNDISSLAPLRQPPPPPPPPEDWPKGQSAPDKAALHRTPSASSSSSSTSLEDYMTSIANSLHGTMGNTSAAGDNDAADTDGEGGGTDGGGGGGGAGAEAAGGDWVQLDERQARKMVARELLRMRSMGFEPGVQVAHLEAESGQAAEPPPAVKVAGPPLPPPPPPLRLPELLLEGASQNRLEATDPGVAAAAAAAADLLPPARFRLTKFHSQAGGGAAGRYGNAGRPALASLTAPEGDSGPPLTAAMLRASAAAALDKARRVSGAGGASRPSAGGGGGGVPRPFAGAPGDSLEAWVRNHSRRAAVGGAAPLTPLDPLDELSEVTRFGPVGDAAGGVPAAASPPPRPPPVVVTEELLWPTAEAEATEAAGEPSPKAMPFLWGSGCQSLNRGARLGTEPEALQIWLHRNDRASGGGRDAAQRQSMPQLPSQLSQLLSASPQALPQQQQQVGQEPYLPGGVREGGGGGDHLGAGAAVPRAPAPPVLRQSLPGNALLLRDVNR